VKEEGGELTALCAPDGLTIHILCFLRKKGLADVFNTLALRSDLAVTQKQLLTFVPKRGFAYGSQGQKGHQERNQEAKED
jgi:hypothetical protein